MAGPWEDFKKSDAGGAPWEDFKPQGDTSTPSMEAIGNEADNLKKQLGGFVQGVADVMNPFNIPHGLEVLARAPFQGFQQAGKSAVLPAIPINELAPNLRAAVRAPFSDQNYSDLYKQEKNSQNDYEKNYVDPAAQNVGQKTAATVGLLDLAGNGANALLNFQKQANLSRVAALGGGKAAVKKLLANDQVQEMGEQLGNDNIMGPFTSRPQIEENLANAQKGYGQQIGDIVSKANEAGGGGEGFIPADQVLGKAVNDVWLPLAKRSTSREAADKVWNEMDAFAKEHGGKNLTLDQLQDFKKDLADKSGAFRTAIGKETPDSQAMSNLYGSFNQSGEQALNDLNLPEGASLEDFQAMKKGYGLSKTAKDMVADRNAREFTNRMFSPSDTGLGAAEFVGDMTSGGPSWLSALKGVGTAVLNKGLRGYGNQMSASGWQALANSLKRQPYSPGVQSAVSSVAPINYLGGQ